MAVHLRLIGLVGNNRNVNLIIQQLQSFVWVYVSILYVEAIC
jgi:hypothetical protein